MIFQRVSVVQNHCYKIFLKVYPEIFSDKKQVFSREKIYPKCYTKNLYFSLCFTHDTMAFFLLCAEL